ncbi:MAG: hypothetical protein KJ674_03530 [Nanoarchaeota archaeon]|nr:hypothetical protein [Nanoarchaeota archaeon]
MYTDGKSFYKSCIDYVIQKTREDIEHLHKNLENDPLLCINETFWYLSIFIGKNWFKRRDLKQVSSTKLEELAAEAYSVL